MTAIFASLPNNSSLEILYDKYAAVLLGAIQLFTNETTVAEKILENLFLNLKLNNLSLANECSQLVFMYKYAIDFTLQSLEKQGISPDFSRLKNCPKIIQLLYENKGIRLQQPFTLPFS